MRSPCALVSAQTVPIAQQYLVVVIKGCVPRAGSTTQWFRAAAMMTQGRGMMTQDGLRQATCSTQAMSLTLLLQEIPNVQGGNKLLFFQ